MARAQGAEAVLQPVQVLDQQVARARRRTEQRLDLGQRGWIDGAALRRGAPLPARRRRGGGDRDRACGHGVAGVQPARAAPPANCKLNAPGGGRLPRAEYPAERAGAEGRGLDLPRAPSVYSGT